MAVGFAAFVTGISTAWWLHHRKKNWFHATATIVDTVSARDRDGLYSPVIAWVDWLGKNRQDVLPLKSAFWKDQIGHTIDIHVDPHRPEKVYFPRQSSPKLFILTVLIMGGVAMMMAGYFIAADSSF